MTVCDFKIIDYGSSSYKACLELREDLLRKPLGLSFSAADVKAEKHHIHIAGYVGELLIATLALVPQGDTYKMQRVAVRADLQSSGIGSAMLRFCESYAQHQGVKAIYCHAREPAAPFYIKNGYHLEGEPFQEQNIPHIKMWKNL